MVVTVIWAHAGDAVCIRGSNTHRRAVEGLVNAKNHNYDADIYLCKRFDVLALS